MNKEFEWVSQKKSPSEDQSNLPVSALSKSRNNKPSHVKNFILFFFRLLGVFFLTIIAFISLYIIRIPQNRIYKKILKSFKNEFIKHNKNISLTANKIKTVNLFEKYNNQLKLVQQIFKGVCFIIVLIGIGSLFSVYTSSAQIEYYIIIPLSIASSIYLFAKKSHINTLLKMLMGK